MILIYSDSDICDIEWINPIVCPDSKKIVHSFDEYSNTPADYKIAFTAQRLHANHDQNCPAYRGFEDKIRVLSQHSDLVFSLESELHHFHWVLWSRCHRPNVYWIQPGMVNDNEEQNSHILFWGDFFKRTANLYKALPNKLAELNPYSEKPKMFDALLGTKKPHRDFVYNYVNQENLHDKFIMTYGGGWNNDKFYARDYFIWEPHCDPCQPIIGTADWVMYCGQKTSLSMVMPMDVYNKTAYSIVAETDHDNTLSFFSEKTAKVLIARRLFVAITGYKFLENLRRLGFATFSDVIDESYDTIKDDKARYQAAMDQVKYLCNQDQTKIYEKIKPVLEHNHNRIMSMDWTMYGVDRVKEVIDRELFGPIVR